MKPLVSVIIAMRNEERYISKSLISIIAQDYPNFEIIVVDGESNDNSMNIAKSFCIDVLVNVKQTSSVGWNLALSKAKGKIIILFSAHAVMHDNFISTAVDYLLDTNVSCVGGKTIDIGENYFSEAIGLSLSSKFGVGNAHYRYMDKEGEVETVAYGTYWRKWIDKVGKFDESLSCNVDWDFNYRLRKARGKILYTPYIKASRYSRDSIRKFTKQHFNYGFWKVRVWNKFPESVLLRHLVPPGFIFTLIILGILGCLIQIARWSFVALAFLYCLADLGASVKAAKGKFKYVPALLAVFPIRHFVFGFGFLVGLIRFGISLKKGN